MLTATAIEAQAVHCELAETLHELVREEEARIGNIRKPGGTYAKLTEKATPTKVLAFERQTARLIAARLVLSTLSHEDFKQRLLQVTAAVQQYLVLLLAIPLLNACSPDFDQPPTTLPCPSATQFSVQLCIDDNGDVKWKGPHADCLNLDAQTAWAPAQGIIQFRSTWQPCQEGFQWVAVQHLCSVPTYEWTVCPSYDYWEATISFPPDECLAEAVPNCYAMTIYGQGCPY